MNRTTTFTLAFAGALAVGHVATIVAAPWAIMHKAMEKLGQGGPPNQFHFGGRTNSHARAVVRPSPDLAYASCIYDLSAGPVAVSAAPTQGGGYVSLSVFDGRTDNIAVFDSLTHPAGIAFVLAMPGQAVPNGAEIVRSRSARGIILDRRQAPTAEAFAVADAARRADRCAPL
jgi:uncharacterized membrane protein